MSLPIACNLTSAELHERRRGVLRKLRSAVIEICEVDAGYAYSFSANTERLRELTELIDFERQCCPFLQFRLTVQAGEGPIWLEVTGPEGTKEFLVSTFEVAAD